MRWSAYRGIIRHFELNNLHHQGKEKQTAQLTTIAFLVVIRSINSKLYAAPVAKEW